MMGVFTRLDALIADQPKRAARVLGVFFDIPSPGLVDEAGNPAGKTLTERETGGDSVVEAVGDQLFGCRDPSQ